MNLDVNVQKRLLYSHVANNLLTHCVSQMISLAQYHKSDADVNSFTNSAAHVVSIYVKISYVAMCKLKCLWSLVQSKQFESRTITGGICQLTKGSHLISYEQNSIQNSHIIFNKYYSKEMTNCSNFSFLYRKITILFIHFSASLYYLQMYVQWHYL